MSKLVNLDLDANVIDGAGIAYLPSLLSLQNLRPLEQPLGDDAVDAFPSLPRVKSLYCE